MSKSQKKPIVKPATRERGEASYFHGQVEILYDFKNLLGSAKTGNSGTSILIQAAPGAGKTALPHECAKLAENTGWEAVRVNTRAFWDTDTMCQSLGDGWMPLLDEIAAQGGFDKWIQIQGAAKFRLPGHPLRVSSNGGRIHSCYSWTRRKHWGRNLIVRRNTVNSYRIPLTYLHNLT